MRVCRDSLGRAEGLIRTPVISTTFASPFKVAPAWGYFKEKRRLPPLGCLCLYTPISFSSPDRYASHTLLAALSSGLLPVALTHGRELFGEWPDLIYTSVESLLRQVWAGKAVII